MWSVKCCFVFLETYSSNPDHAHSDRIVAVDAAHKLKLFASCSVDCTVRIWTEDNHPLRSVTLTFPPPPSSYSLSRTIHVTCMWSHRFLHLDCPADGLVFCSLQADIILAMNSHLYTLANFTCMFTFHLAGHSHFPMITHPSILPHPLSSCPKPCYCNHFVCAFRFYGIISQAIGDI